MFRAVIFDFNGVLVDDEPLHFALFQQTLKKRNIPLSSADYYEKYLGYDDRDCFAAILSDANLNPDSKLIDELILEKSSLYDAEAQRKSLFVENAVQFVKQSAQKYVLGIVSGALKQEIVEWLDRGGITSCFRVIIAAENVTQGKPHPEGYLKALAILNLDLGKDQPLMPHECLVIEDSMWGIEAAHGAGMKCIGLTTSYTREELKKGDWVFDKFSEIEIEALS